MFTEVMDPISEKIDQHVEDNHDAVTLVTADGPAIPGTSAFCIVYVSGRPVLQWVKAVLFFKPKWRAVVTVMIAGLDALCAGTATLPENKTTPANNGAAVDQKDESPQ